MPTMETKVPPPYQINIRDSAVFWKSEHAASYAPLKMREKRELVNKSQNNKIQITYPFSFSKA